MCRAGRQRHGHTFCWARTTMLPAGSRQLGHTFCWKSLIRCLALRGDRIAAPVRSLMGNTVQTTASSASDRGFCQAIFGPQSEGELFCELVVDVLVTIFCWCSLIMWLPLRDDRIAAPVRVPMEKTVQTTASSSSDRGSCEVLFPSYGERGQG